MLLLIFCLTATSVVQLLLAMLIASLLLRSDHRGNNVAVGTCCRGALLPSRLDVRVDFGVLTGDRVRCIAARIGGIGAPDGIGHRI